MTSKLSLFSDFYEFIMAYGYFKQGLHKKIAYFDVFFRSVPDEASFSIIAGLQSIVSYVKALSFDEDDINTLRKSGYFDEEFLEFLKTLRFSGDIYAFKEGSVAFAHEPILIVRAPIIEAQLMETFILAVLNHQSLIATKASRIVRAAYPKAVIEYGARRAHGVEAATNGARSAIIAGCIASSNTLSCKEYAITPSGTMAHSWVLMFPSELEAFYAYTKLFDDNLVLLIDTYDPITGVQNAITAFLKTLKTKKLTSFGVRLDSGELASLSKQIRSKLDEAGLKECKIYVSGGLDEFKIAALLQSDAKIDAFGVGEKLITSASDPVFGAVYKLAALEDEKGLKPKMKLSLDKANLPHFKKVVRFYKNNLACFDKLYIHDEEIQSFKGYEAKELLEPIFINSKLVYKLPSLNEIANHTKTELLKLAKPYKRLQDPKSYELKISKKLLALKSNLSSH